MTRIATPGTNITANHSARRARCGRVRSSRRNIRFMASLRTPKLAIRATTPIFTSSVMRCCSTYNRSTEIVRLRPHCQPLIIIKLVEVARYMEDTSGFVLSQAAEASFPTEYGLFRIYGFEGRTGDRLEEAVV